MKSSKDAFMETREEEQADNIFARKLKQMKEKGTAVFDTVELTTNTPSRTQIVSNALQTILSLDAANIDTLARAVVNEVADGNKDALEVLITAKKGAAARLYPIYHDHQWQLCVVQNTSP